MHTTREQLRNTLCGQVIEVVDCVVLARIIPNYQQPTLFLRGLFSCLSSPCYCLKQNVHDNPIPRHRYRFALQDVRTVLSMPADKVGSTNLSLANGMQHRLNRVVQQLKNAS